MAVKFAAPWFLSRAPAHIAFQMGVAGLVLTLGFAIWIGWTEYDRRLREAKQSIETEAYFLADHSSRLFGSVQISLETAAAMVADRDWNEVEQSQELRLQLESFVRVLPYIRNIWLNDETGRLRATSFAFPAPASNADGSENFERAQNGEDGLVIGAQILGTLTNEITFPIIKRMEAPDGSFRGVVSVTAGLDYFSDYWKEVRVSDGTCIELFRIHPTTGIPDLLLQFPLVCGNDLAALTADDAASLAEEGASRVLEDPVGFVALQSVQSFPLLLRASVPTRFVNLDWWRWFGIYGPMIGLAMAGLGLLTALALRQARIDDQAMTALVSTNRELTAEIRGREQAEQQVQQMQKMQAIGQLTGGIAHDFNNLLTVILGNADLLVSQAADRPRLLRSAQLVVGAAERGAELTSRLLAYSRRQPLDPHPLDVNVLLRNLQQLLTQTIGAEVELRFAPATDLWNAIVDPGQLETAIINLAANARDAMPHGGMLTIETANVWADENYAAGQPEVTPGPYVLVAVADTGTGMTPDVVQRAFEPFFTTKSSGKGSGLGLSMVYGFANQSGGHVKLESEPGKGTTVKLYLPRSMESAAALLEDRQASGSLLGRERILVVEDDAEVLAFTSDALRQYGYGVVSATRASEALKLLDEGESFDLLFTDVVLPGGTHGPQLAVQAVARLPKLKVLFTSGYTKDAMIHQGRLDPGVNLLSKPFRKLDLAIKIRKVLDD